MSYVDGFVTAVPVANKAAYQEIAEKSAVLFKRYGALSIVETWGDDLPEGKVNSFHTAVMRKDDETVVFSWVTWPSKEARNEAWAKMQDDPEMTGMEMPFDGKRLIYGGFELLVEA